MNNIPKVIHYCWFGKNKKSKLIKKCIASWKKYCPDYQIVEWNEDNFDINMNSYVNEAYISKKWAFVSDYARLYIIYNYGGIYFDTDVELIKNIDELLSYNSFFAIETTKYVATGLGFGAFKNNKLVKLMLASYDNVHFKKNDGSYDELPCPVRNTESILETFKLADLSNKSIAIVDNNAFLSSEYFCPFIPSTGEMKITNNTLGIHWYNASWRNKSTNIKGVLLRPLKRAIGLERFTRIKKRLKGGDK